MPRSRKTKAFLVYFQDIVSGGMDGGVFKRDYVVCMTPEARDREMARMDEKQRQEYRDDCGEEWEPYTSKREDETEGAHFEEVNVLE